ncbi:IS110 family RNA-guided transposase [Marinobacter confluentis]|uniref:IS110 family transposase n=1 Tax=Marinobacter confluentis TaxID=1697557 RepID=A0A4Z1BAU6_9GAMM|nr:IS110 family transposase [Marinobacter confluentis]TGN38976.1 IS110 family transposase [Marinobacter confluentis]
MNPLNHSNETNVGVDVSKAKLDICIRPNNETFTVDNSPEGIRIALKKLRQVKPDRIVCEATGRLELAFINACRKAGFSCVISDPVRIKKFAGVLGQRAKTDYLDAQLIAQFAEVMRPEPTPKKAESLNRISDLLTRRNQLIDLRTQEKNRMKIMPKFLTHSMKAVIKHLDMHIQRMEVLLELEIEKDADYDKKTKIIKSVPGVGNVVALTLLADLPELGTMSNKQAASLVGVAPISRESGTFRGKRYIRGGRAKVRTAMFMAMMSAIQCNSKFKALYQRLVDAGKAKRAAIIACVRKMVVVLNSMVRSGKTWDPNLAI